MLSGVVCLSHLTQKSTLSKLVCSVTNHTPTTRACRPAESTRIGVCLQYIIICPHYKCFISYTVYEEEWILISSYTKYTHPVNTHTCIVSRRVIISGSDMFI